MTGTPHSGRKTDERVGLGPAHDGTFGPRVAAGCRRGSHAGSGAVSEPISWEGSCRCSCCSPTDRRRWCCRRSPRCCPTSSTNRSRSSRSRHALQLEPEAMFIDAAEHPSQAFTVLQALHERDPRVPVVLVVERDTIERYPWHELADEFLYPGAPAPEVRVRLAMLRRRAGSGDGTRHAARPHRPRHRDLPGDGERSRARPDLQGVRAAALPRVEPRAGSTPGPRCCGRSGDTTSTAARERSTYTCVACARSSAPNTST